MARSAAQAARWLACQAVWAVVRAWQYPALVRLERRPAVPRPLPPARRYAVLALRGGACADPLGAGLAALFARLRGRACVIAVVNGPLSATDHAALAAAVDVVAVRPGFGRDFAAYQDATLAIHDSGMTPDRVLYLNDSVVYLDTPGLGALVDRLLDDPAPVLGATRSFAPRPHLGSFALSLSGAAFRHPEVAAFWRRYRGYDLRPHAILRGELGLSRALARAGFPLTAVYTPADAARRLRDLDTAGLWQAFAWLPGAARSAFLDRLAAFREAPPPEELLRQAALDQFFAAENLSHVHHYCGLFHRLLGMPLIKKDLLYRGILDEKDLAAILDDCPPDQTEAALAALNRRGREATQNPAALLLRRLLMLD